MNSFTINEARKENYMVDRDEPIRVAQIMGKLWAGGVEMVVFNYYRAIDKKKIQFDFYYDADSTVKPPQELIDMGARFYEIPPYQNLPLYLKTLRKHFKNHNYKIVHSHINTLSVFPLFVAWMCNIPVRIAHNHSVPSGKEIKRDILKYFLRCFAKIFSTDYFACSEKAGRWMWGNKTYEAGKVFVLKNATDFERFFYPEEKVAELRKKLELEKKIVIGHVGRFTSAKNHRFLLEIFRNISEENDKFRLLLVGDGELRDTICCWIKENNLQNKVVFAGQVNNPEIYYQLMDVVVIPSTFEGLSLAAIESQISGVPVVASTAVPSEAVISDGCIRLELDSNKWEENILNMIGKQVHLDSRSKDYNIKIAVKKLEDWYEKYNL